MKRLIIRSLIIFITTLLLIEGLLRLFDPWGALRYQRDMALYFQNVEASPARDYLLRPGFYAFSNWTATILPDSSRAVPDTNAHADCTLALVGDSVTFGYGVSDADTWANLLARDFPAVHIINTGTNGYNIADAYQTANAVPANGYLYLMIYNDAEPRFDTEHFSADEQLSALATYLKWTTILRGAGSVIPVDMPMFLSTLARLGQRSDIQIVAFDGNPLTAAAQGQDADIKIVRAWTHNNSRVDPHPNVEGSREIAEEMKPYFEALVKRVCKE